MSETKFHYFTLILLIFINSIIASTSDGFCAVQETFLEPKTFIETYNELVEFTRRCGIFSSFCYGYRFETFTHRAVRHVTKTRTKRQCCQGYIEKQNNCIPICTMQCINGQCTAPNNCTCDPGYEPSDRIGSCISKCKDGYKYNEDSTICDSVCNVPCSNGICTETEPDVCKCSSNYHKNADGICIKNECDPSTPESNECHNGTCSSNGVCLCDEGFVKNDTNLKCHPVCESCVNGSCIAPNKCLCNDGFEWSITESKCQPKCSEGCLNGICVSPENCVCNVGYEILNSSVCAPICNQKCANSDCTSPNVCPCQMGYHKNGECVQSECSPNETEDICRNGYCSDGGICLCNAGYEKNDSTICVPICSLVCVNGYCSEPDVCQCYEGYDLRNTSINTYIGSNCNNCTTISYWNICDPMCDGSSKEKCIGTGNCNCTNSNEDDPKTGTFSNRESSFQLGWIIISVAIVGVVIVASIFMYRTYFRLVRYNRGADVALCEDENNYESL